MENATKALIIAGTILISLLLISIAVYVFNNYAGFAIENQERQAAQDKIQFNTQFEKYVEKDLTIHDVVTIANLAKDYNEKNQLEDKNKIKIYLGTTECKDNKDWIEELKKPENSKYKYKIGYYSNSKNVGIKYDNYGIVSEVHITVYVKEPI